MSLDVNYERIDTALKKAGLSLNEAAAIFHVSRPTLYNWKNGRGTNNTFVLGTIMRLVTLLEGATAAGKLPLGKDIEFADRLPKVNMILMEQRAATS